MSIKINGGIGINGSTQRPVKRIVDGKPAYKGNGSEHASDLNPALAVLFSRIASPKTLVADTPTASVKEQDENSLVFRPFKYRNPGLSRVHIRGKGSGDDAYINIDYKPESIPDMTKKSRSEIKLEGINPKIVSQAKLVAKVILEEWKIAQELKKEYKACRSAYREALRESFKYKVKPKLGETRKKTRYKSTDEKTGLRNILADIKQRCEDHPFASIYGKNTTTTMEVFSGVFDKKIDELIGEREVSLKLRTNKAFESLVAYLCLRNDKKRGFTSLPNGFFNYDNPDLIERITSVGRYFTVNQMGLDNAEKVEKVTNWSAPFVKAGLQKLNKLISAPELLKLLFPGYLDGGNPPVREWVLPMPNKWQGDESDEDRIWSNAIRACKFAVIDQGIADPTTGVVNTEVLLEKDLGQIFYDQKYCLRGAIGVCDFLKGSLDALELAIPGILKVYPRHRFKYPNKWTDETRFTLIDEITKFIVEKKLKLVDEHGIVNAQKVKDVSDWRKQYDDECTGGLNRSGVGNAYEALKRVYPQLFGWGVNQVQPGEIRYGGMWDGEDGERLFKLKFAKSLYVVFEMFKNRKVKGFENHGVEFFPESQKPLKLPRKDFIALKNYYISHSIGWYDHFLSFNLTAGFVDVAKDQANAFELLLGAVNPKTNCYGISHIKVEDVVDRNPTRTYLVSSLLADVSGDLEHQDINISGLRRHGYDMNRTGIEGTCLEPYMIHRPESDVLEKTNALYQTFAATVLSSSTQDRDSREKDRYTAIEKILIATDPFILGDKKLIISNRRLRHLLRFLSEDVIPNVTITDELKTQLIKMINSLVKLKKPANDPREILLAAAQTDRKYGDGKNPFGVLNTILENVLEAVAIYEIRYEKANGCNSAHFERVLGNIRVDDDDSSKDDAPEPDKELLAEKLDEAKREAEAITKKAKQAAKGATSVEAIVEAEAALEAVAAIEELGEMLLMGSEWESVLDETRKICEGRFTENKEITQTLINLSRDKTHSRKHLHEFLRCIDEGSLPVQLRLLYQIGERSKKRSLDRFEYGTLRARVLPTTSINMIVYQKAENVSEAPSDVESALSTNLEPGSSPDTILDLANQPLEAQIDSGALQDPESSLGIIPDLSNLDTELLKCIPAWWPHNLSKEPKAIPLLYYDNVLYIALPANHDELLPKQLAQKLNGYEVQFKIVRADSWFKLVNFYKRNSEVRILHPETRPLNQFISDNEEALIIENIAALRKAVNVYRKTKREKSLASIVAKPKKSSLNQPGSLTN